MNQWYAWFGSEENPEPDIRLPFWLFATDRYPICWLNIYSKPDTLTVLHHLLRNSPQFQQILNSSFGGLFHLSANRAPISCKLIQALIVRQIVTKQKFEMWTVFCGQPLRFSLHEFQSITGLKCALFEEGYETPSSEISLKEPDRYWKRWIGDNMDPDRRLRLALLLIVDCVLIANHQTHTPTPRYVKMLDNLDEFLNFPWGREAFPETLWSMCPPRISPSKSKDSTVQIFCKQLKQKSIKLNGFPLALQLLAFRAIPGLLENLPDPSDRLRIIDPTSEGFPNNSAVTLNDVLDSEIYCNLAVNPLIESPSNRDVGVGEWDDKIRDRKVDYMLNLINQNQPFVKDEWLGGDSSCPRIVHQPFHPTGSHRRHIINQIKSNGHKKQSYVVWPPPPLLNPKRRLHLHSSTVSCLTSWTLPPTSCTGWLSMQLS
ncbi:hypothetical protein EUTSA_v10012362mg [Eutrema salsugineum]|uniref:DUF1985 domain-containing protein n=1 Tax=Eutrema salsugineum TaxID=72664 RepID=V4KHU3_EUTSA|nr:hypothetical protein EUTSA_v10012362mg [Eutrema salsugineum]